jgi:hypothetical protein
MINLLPDDAKNEIHAARTNVMLVKYIVILVLGGVFLCLISVAVYFVLVGTRTNAESILSDNTTKTNAYTPVQAQATALRSSLASAKVILDKEVVYTKVLTSIAKAVPAGVVLDSLSLSPTTFGVPITLQAFAKTNDDALALKSNFQKSPLFSNVTFVSLSGSAQTKSGAYPVTASLSLIINKSAAQ